jgi:hypothetical protein
VLSRGSWSVCRVAKISRWEPRASLCWRIRRSARSSVAATAMSSYATEGAQSAVATRTSSVSSAGPPSLPPWRKRLLPRSVRRRRLPQRTPAARATLAKATGDEQFAVEQTEPEFEEVEGEIVARTHEIARWRETGDIAYERDFAVRLTLDDEKIVRIVVMPGGAPPP